MCVIASEASNLTESGRVSVMPVRMINVYSADPGGEGLQFQLTGVGTGFCLLAPPLWLHISSTLFLV